MADSNRGRGSAERTGSGARGGLILALVLLAAVLALVVARWHPPAAVAGSASTGQFSGARALELLGSLEGDGAPHPIGSEANARLRERIVAQLRWLGYTPEIQATPICSQAGQCATAQNILARLPGREAGKQLLLLAHYDSVAAGPGASDDLSGTVTLLEAARVLKASPQARRGILFLFTDGEEAGLLGAQAFVDKSPTFAEVGAVANFEARGTSGPSLMFETSGAEAWLVGMWASQAEHPFTSSLLPTVYDRMPNDTDLTLFKAKGVPGLNFAFIGDPRRYHTPLDDVAHASAATLQHHGENAIAVARSVANADLDHPQRGRAVFFDLFRHWVVRWPAGWSPVLAALALVLLIVARLRARRGAGVAPGGFVAGLAAPLTLGLAAGVAGYLIFLLLRHAFPEPWITRPTPEAAAFWLAGLGAALALAALLTRGRPSDSGVWSGVWIFWAVLGLILALCLPGVCFLFVVPALIAGLVGLTGLPQSEGTAGRFLASFLPALVAAGLWYPILVNLYLGLGVLGLVGTALLLGILLSTLTPLAAVSAPFGRKVVPALAAVAALIAVFVGIRTPPFSPDSPRPMNLALYQDEGTARWLFRAAGRVPPPLAEAAKFGTRSEPAFPWSAGRYTIPVAPAERIAAPLPELTVIKDETIEGKRHLTLRLVSPRGAAHGSVIVPEAAHLLSIRIDGAEVPEKGDSKGARRGGDGRDAYRPFQIWSLPPLGSQIEVVLNETAPQEWYAVDRTDGLPPSGGPLLAARPAYARPASEGDLTILARKVKI